MGPFLVPFAVYCGYLGGIRNAEIRRLGWRKISNGNDASFVEL